MYTTNRINDYWCWLWSSGSSSVCQFFTALKLFFCPLFHIVLLGSILEDRLSAEVNLEFYKGDLSVALLLIIYIKMDAQVHFIPWVLSQYFFLSVAETVSVVDTGNSLSWLLCFFDISLSLWLLFVFEVFQFFWAFTLLSATYKVLQAHLIYFLPQSWNQSFLQRPPHPFIGDCY